MDTTIEFCIFVLVLVPGLTLNWQIWILGPNLPEKVFLVKNGKYKHHHGILHIQISHGTKFQLKLTILMFRPNMLKKGISRLKQKTRNFACVMVVTYYIKLFHTWAHRHNGILMRLLLLVAGTINKSFTRLHTFRVLL